MNRVVLVFLIGLFSFSAMATPAGWHWYNGLKIPKQKKQTQKKWSMGLSPTQQIAQQTQAIEEAKARAILNPTIKNVAHFYQLQKQAMDEADNFGQSSAITFLFHPELNYLVKQPAENAAQPILNALDNEKAKRILTQLSHRFLLFFFYKGGDALDNVFSTTVLSFAQTVGFEFMAVSVDGIENSTFKQSMINNGQMERLHVTATPALILFDPNTNTMVPYHYGFASMTGLTEQAFVIENYLKKEGASGHD